MRDATRSNFIPALKHHVLTPLYDVLARVTIPEMRVKRHLIRAARIAAGDRVLDIGCGTGTLLRIAADQQPRGTFIGIDPDPRILDRARRKFAPQSRVTFQEGSATELPFADGSFDRVLSTLMLPSSDRRRVGPSDARGAPCIARRRTVSPRRFRPSRHGGDASRVGTD
jgi:SAM-dependent methyltransferase